MKFNENLKYLRKEAKLTQEQLAEKLNVSRQAVTKWESGQSLPDIQNLKEMADMFGVTMDALVGDIGTKKESVMNKKINDIGYFIFGIVILFLFVINSISETVGSITGDENKKIISYIILGIIGFLLFFSTKTFGFVIAISMICGFSITAYICNICFSRIFKKYDPEEESDPAE